MTQQWALSEGSFQFCTSQKTHGNEALDKTKLKKKTTPPTQAETEDIAHLLLQMKTEGPLLRFLH